jgi:hypothetical protein
MVTTPERYTGQVDEDTAVFTFEMDNNAVCVGWACDERKIQSVLLDTVDDGYGGISGSNAVELRIGDWLRHSIATIDDAKGLDPWAKRFVTALLTGILNDGSIISSIGELAAHAAGEREVNAPSDSLLD